MKKVDVQYAIEAIENISLHNRWDRDLYGEKVHKTVIKALEKQIPKKPKREPDKPFPGEEGGCPCCEASVYFWDNKYCGYCGQALDWSDIQ